MILFLGGETTRRADWEQFVTWPKKTGDAKADAKAEKEIAEIRQDADYQPYWSRPTRLVAVNVRGEVVFDQARGPETPVLSQLFCSFLARYLADVSPELQRADLWQTADSAAAPLAGFNVRRLLRVIAADVRSNDPRTPHLGNRLPVNLWYHPTFMPPQAVDPLEILLHRSEQTALGLPELCRFYGLPFAEPRDAMTSAMLAGQLAVAAGLVFSPK